MLRPLLVMPPRGHFSRHPRDLSQARLHLVRARKRWPARVPTAESPARAKLRAGNRTNKFAPPRAADVRCAVAVSTVEILTAGDAFFGAALQAEVPLRGFSGRSVLILRVHGERFGRKQ